MVILRVFFTLVMRSRMAIVLLRKRMDQKKGSVSDHFIMFRDSIGSNAFLLDGQEGIPNPADPILLSSKKAPRPTVSST